MLLIITLVEHIHLKNIRESVNNTITVTNDQCNISLNNLPLIEDEICCQSGHKIFNGKELSVNPVYYVNACESACTYGLDGNDCVDGIGAQNFRDCIQPIQPIDCDASALPYARKGNELWYIYSYSIAACVQIDCNS